MLASIVIFNFSNVLPYMSRLIWPWPAAFVRGVEQTQASAQIDVPCGETLPEVPPEGSRMVIGQGTFVRQKSVAA